MLDIKDITLTRNERIVLEALRGRSGSATTLWDLRNRLEGLPIGPAGRLAIKLEKMGLVRLFRVGSGGRNREYVITANGIEALKGFDPPTNGKEIDDTDLEAISPTVTNVVPTSDMVSARKITPAPSTNDLPDPSDRLVFVVTDDQLAKILREHVTMSVTALTSLQQENTDLRQQLDAALLAVENHRSEMAACREETKAALQLADEATSRYNTLRERLSSAFGASS